MRKQENRSLQLFRNQWNIACGALVMCVAGLTPTFSMAQSFDETEFRAFVASAMEVTDVPGVAVAIVYGDDVLFADGFGKRAVGRSESVTADTLFAIGSNSKMFTATALGLLVEDGSIGWDDKLVDRVPGFRTSDPVLTSQLSIRDALAHRSGLARADAVWHINEDASEDEIFNKTPLLPTVREIRSGFFYNNFMYLAAGRVIPAVTTKSWAEFIDKRLFQPIGMERSNTNIAELSRDSNVASPHTEKNGKTVTTPYHDLTNIAPAGAINSSANDMARWCQLQVNNGEIDGTRVVGESILNEIRTPQNLIRLPRTPTSHYGFEHAAYSLGLGRGDYRGGPTMYLHRGGIDGMLSAFRLIPEEELCVVVLTNKHPNFQLEATISGWILDDILGMEPLDWYQFTVDFQTAYRGMTTALRDHYEASRVSGTQASLALEEYSGSYREPLYGEVKVKVDDGKLQISWGKNYDGTLSHRHFDTFEVQWNREDLDLGVAHFSLDSAGKISTLTVSTSIGGEEIVLYRELASK